MTGLTFRQEFSRFFQKALATCDGHAGLRPLRDLIEAQAQKVEEPMRVAFVGTTNAGKSTMMNGFLGVDHAPMGNGELTNKVTWFKYGERKRLLVHYKGKSPQEESFEHLALLSTRGGGADKRQDSILFLEIQMPNPLLREFELIDTPGLDSFYGESKETTALLTSDATRPDAMVFLFPMTLQGNHIKELKEFHQQSGSLMTGLTAIGVHTKIDSHPNDLEDGRANIAVIEQKHPEARRMFYRMLPAMGKLAFGAQTLTEADWQTLLSIAQLPAATRMRLLISSDIYTKSPFDDPAMPSPEARLRLYDRLDLKGTRWALELLDQGVTDRAEIISALLKRSQVGPLRQTVVSHFGSRAWLLKSKTALDAIKSRAEHLRTLRAGAESEAAAKVAIDAESILVNTPQFREFTILQEFYNNRVQLEDCEEAWLREVTGECGKTCAERLGLPLEASLDAMLERCGQRLSYWHIVENEWLTGESRRRIARALQHSYGHLQNRIQEARELRRRADELLASC